MFMKKNSTTASIFLIVVTFVAIAIGVHASLKNEKTTKDIHSTPHSEATKLTKRDVESSKRNEQKVRLESFKRTIRNIEKTINEEPMNDASETTPMSQADEKSRIRELFKKTDPVFFEMAPIILAEMLKDEPADRDWGLEVEQKLNEALEDPRVADSIVTEVDCRNTLCKATVMLTAEDKLDAFTDTWMKSGPKLENLFQHHDEMLDGQVRTSVYFSKEGTPDPFLKMRELMLARIEK